MHLLTFEPGDGKSYRILFGRLPLPTPALFSHYIVFGISVGSDNPGAWHAFDTTAIDYETFAQHLGDHEALAVGWQTLNMLRGATIPPDPSLGWASDWDDRFAEAMQRAGALWIELRPCPFCGHKPEYVDYPDAEGRRCAVRCTNCGAEAEHPFLRARVYAREHWNQRTG